MVLRLVLTWWIFFGIIAWLYIPSAVVSTAFSYVLAIVAIGSLLIITSISSAYVLNIALIPTVANVLRLHLIGMDHYYRCAIGEDGFTDEGYLEWEQTKIFLEMKSESLDLWNSIPLGYFFNNKALITDIDALFLTYSQ